jgi:hypothetical protein
MSELRCVGDLFPSADSRTKGRHLGPDPSVLVVRETVEVEAWDEDRVVSVTADPRLDMSELRCVGDLFPSAESRPKGRHLGLEPSVLVVWEMVEVEAWGPC